MRVQWVCSLCCVNLCAHLGHFDQCTICNEYFGICTLQYICVLHIACNARLLCTFLLCTLHTVHTLPSGAQTGAGGVGGLGGRQASRQQQL